MWWRSPQRRSIRAQPAWRLLVPTADPFGTGGAEKISVTPPCPKKAKVVSVDRRGEPRS